MKRVTSLVGTAVVALGLIVGGGSAAQADPYDCTTWYPQSHLLSAKCTNGTGEYRVTGKCDRPWASDMSVTGPWVRIGQTSSTDCIDLGRKYRAYGISVQVR